MILNKGSDSSLNFRFYIDSSSNYTFDTFNPRLYQNSFGKVQENVWVHFSLIVNDTKQEVFKGGQLVQSGFRTGNVYKDDSPLQLGSKFNPQTRFREFSIDDLRIYDRALSAAEVQALYQLGN